MITQSITDLPPPPSSADAANFRTKADVFMAALDDFAAELNAFSNQANALEENVNTKESSAVAAALAASISANFKGTFVQGTSAALAGESWHYSGIIYRCLTNTSNNPITEPTSWISMSMDDQIHSAFIKSILDDADELGVWDSIGGGLVKISILNLFSRYASATKGGTIKMRVSGSTLYITNNGSDA